MKRGRPKRVLSTRGWGDWGRVKKGEMGEVGESVQWERPKDIREGYRRTTYTGKAKRRTQKGCGKGKKRMLRYSGELERGK